MKNIPECGLQRIDAVFGTRKHIEYIEGLNIGKHSKKEIEISI